MAEFIPTLPVESTRNLSVPPAASTAKDALPAELSASTIKKSVPLPVIKDFMYVPVGINLAS